MSEKMKKLKEKASIFHQLQRGRFRVILWMLGDKQPDEKNCLIDFKRRKEMYDFYGLELPDNEKPQEGSVDDPMSLVRDRYVDMLNEPHKDNEELIEDEFGRLRWVRRGSDEYMNYIGSAYRIRQELKGKSTEADPKAQKPMSSWRNGREWEVEAARVKMTWESKGSRSERDYFVEIDVRLRG